MTHPTIPRTVLTKCKVVSEPGLHNRTDNDRQNYGEGRSDSGFEVNAQALNQYKPTSAFLLSLVLSLPCGAIMPLYGSSAFAAPSSIPNKRQIESEEFKRNAKSKRQREIEEFERNGKSKRKLEKEQMERENINNAGDRAVVRRYQNILKGLGFDPGAIDGLLGGNTTAAIARFQRSRGLAADGILGVNTKRALGSASVKTVNSSSNKPTAQNDLGRYQRLLSNHGYNPGPIDGLPGSRTTSAIQSFQQDRGLSADGIIGPRTIRALEQSTQARELSAEENLRPKTVSAFKKTTQTKELLGIEAAEDKLLESDDPDKLHLINPETGREFNDKEIREARANSAQRQAEDKLSQSDDSDKLHLINPETGREFSDKEIREARANSARRQPQADVEPPAVNDAPPEYSDVVSEYPLYRDVLTTDTHGHYALRYIVGSSKGFAYPVLGFEEGDDPGTYAFPTSSDIEVFIRDGYGLTVQTPKEAYEGCVLVKDGAKSYYKCDYKVLIYDAYEVTGDTFSHLRQGEWYFKNVLMNQAICAAALHEVSVLGPKKSLVATGAVTTTLGVADLVETCMAPEPR